jgi:very-short-patch-repair endonuclease
VKQETLLEEGWEKPEEDDPHPTPLPKGEGIESDTLSLRERAGVRDDLALTKPPLPDHILKACRDLRKNSTDAEQLLWEILRDRRLYGIKFRRQHPIGKFILDFYSHENKLAIELDGGGHNEQQQKQYDEQRTKSLEGEGIKVLRFWNHDVLQKTEVVLEVIWNALGQRPHPDPLPEGEGARKEIKKHASLLKEKFITGKYEGNKWGGKYLRAPDIFFTILEKGKGKLVRLGDIAEVRFGIKTGCNEFFYLTPLTSPLIKGGHRGVLKVRNGAGWEGEIEEEFLKPVIKSPRECKNIMIKPEDLRFKVFMCHKDKKELKGTSALKYIEWGEKQGFHKRPSCKSRQRWWDLGENNAPIIIRSTFNDKFDFFFNPKRFLLDKVMYGIFARGDTELISMLLNTTFVAMYIEIYGTYGLGEGALFVAVYNFDNILIISPTAISPMQKEILSKVSEKLLMRETLNIYAELGINPSLPIREQKPNPLPDRKSLDDIVFDILGLTEDERNEVYWAVCELVKNRLEKARSV